MSLEEESPTTSTTKTEQATGTPELRVEGISKQFGRILAVDEVSLEVRSGNIFALVGDNGAGKSTLMNILSGVHQPTKGNLYKGGEEVSFTNPSEARAKGIETVYQDLALMDDLDIGTNIFMGQFPKRGIGPIKFIDWETTYKRAEHIIADRLGRNIDIKTEVEFLSGGQRQLVAIGRALAFDPDVIILDEPTSALSVDATRLVQDTLNTLAESGITIIIVSHNIESVLTHADRIGVLFQGSLVDTYIPSETGLEELNEVMTTGFSSS
jgi:ABC-type sugar transport system ATPase subunit